MQVLAPAYMLRPGVVVARQTWVREISNYPRYPELVVLNEQLVPRQTPKSQWSLGTIFTWGEGCVNDYPNPNPVIARATK